MAKVAEDLTITVNAKLSVDKNTAEACLKMVELFLNANRNYDVISTKRDNGEIKLSLWP